MADKLNIGDAFPALTFNAVGGGTFSVPEAAAKYNIILFYRGHW
jgi:peroxiredoxin